MKPVKRRARIFDIVGKTKHPNIKTTTTAGRETVYNEVEKMKKESVRPLKLDRLLSEQDADKKYKENADATWGDARRAPSRRGKPYFPNDPENMDPKTVDHYTDQGMNIRRRGRGRRS